MNAFTLPNTVSQSTLQAAQLHQFDIPLSPHLPVAKQRIDVRQGLILSLKTQQQQVQVEISPLSGTDVDGKPIQGFSQETLAEIIEQLSLQLPTWIGKPLQTIADFALQTKLPALAYGLTLALAKFAELLPSRSKQFTEIPLIYLPSAAHITTDDMLKLIQQQLAQHPHALMAKIKVGQLSMATELALIHAVLAAKPSLKLRLDANRAFSYQQALDFCACLPLESIVYIEEPCQDPLDSQRLAQALEINFALDETLQDPDYQFLPMQGLRALVIKPMLIGHLQKLIDLIEQAEQAGCEIVFSSTLESNIGIDDLRLLSTWLSPEQTPGLNTLAPFTQQLFKPDADKPCLQLEDLNCLFQGGIL